jgi:hypothetical protein
VGCGAVNTIAVLYCAKVKVSSMLVSISSAQVTTPRAPGGFKGISSNQDSCWWRVGSGGRTWRKKVRISGEYGEAVPAFVLGIAGKSAGRGVSIGGEVKVMIVVVRKRHGDWCGHRTDRRIRSVVLSLVRPTITVVVVMVAGILGATIQHHFDNKCKMRFWNNILLFIN